MTEHLFFIACQKEHVEIVKILLNDQRVDPNKANYYGETPFYVACEKGYIEIVKLLLNVEKVDINKADRNGTTPLHLVCKIGYIEIMEYILTHEKVDLKATNNRRKMAIETARIIKEEEKYCENEEGDQKRKTKWAKIVELLELFERYPNETRTKLRMKFGFAGKIFS